MKAMCIDNHLSKEYYINAARNQKDITDRIEAMVRGDAKEYARLTVKLGIEPENEELYQHGLAIIQETKPSNHNGTYPDEVSDEVKAVIVSLANAALLSK